MRQDKNRSLLSICAVLSVIAALSPSVDAAKITPLIAITSTGPTPFICPVYLPGKLLVNMSSLSYTIQPKPGSVSKPVHVSFTPTALQSHGYISSSGVITIPIFGLYDNYTNLVSIQVLSKDGSQKTLSVSITTPAWEDKQGVYDRPTILVPRKAGSALGFDYFAMKSSIESTVIVDTDGEVRWIGTGFTTLSQIFTNNGFIVGNPGQNLMQRIEMDGTYTHTTVQDSSVIDFNHNIDPGLQGLLAEFDITGNYESTLKEITPAGAVINTWDMAQIISAYMTSQGDDPSNFVRPGMDWFHMNSSVYDPSDNSVIVSSRENFVVKVDYVTGNIIWILGDPTKYWYTFPSLRAKALQLNPGGLYPIGQHGLSITSDGLLMLYNDGLGSLNQPAGEPAGETRTYSAVSAYSINTTTMSATDTWDFDYGQSIDSNICSSAYEASGQSILVDYAVASNGTMTRMVGLDQNHNVVFDFQYTNYGCGTSWNAVPIPLDAMSFE